MKTEKRYNLIVIPFTDCFILSSDRINFKVNNNVEGSYISYISHDIKLNRYEILLIIMFSQNYINKSFLYNARPLYKYHSAYIKRHPLLEKLVSLKTISFII